MFLLLLGCLLFLFLPPDHRGGGLGLLRPGGPGIPGGDRGEGEEAEEEEESGFGIIERDPPRPAEAGACRGRGAAGGLEQKGFFYRKEECFPAQELGIEGMCQKISCLAGSLLRMDCWWPKARGYPKDALKSAKAKKASLFDKPIEDSLSLSPFQISVIGSASSTLVGSLSHSRGRPVGTESPAAVDLSASFDIHEHVRRGMMTARSPSREMVKRQEETGEQKFLQLE